MKKTLSLLITFYTLVSFGNISQPEYKISGTLNNLSENWIKKIYLLEINMINNALASKSSLVIDSAEINDDGYFEFNELSKINKNNLYRLNVIRKNNYPNGASINRIGTQENFIFISFLETFKIKVNADISKFSYTSKIKYNDNTNNMLASFLNLRKSEMVLMDSMFIQFQNVKNDPIKSKDIQINAFKIFASFSENYKLFADTCSLFLPSILASQFLNLKRDSSIFSKLNNRYQISNPKHAYSIQFNQLFENEFICLPTNSIPPEFSIPTIDGTIINLSDFKGKYVLIDFWASYCKPCRIENKEVVLPLYKKYKSKGFEVISISKDNDRTKWLNAVKEDKIIWVNVSDLNPNASVFYDYKIKSLPTTYIISPNGKIIAKNLRGMELITFIDNVWQKDK